MSKRKETEDFIKKYIFKLTKSKKNLELYENLFKKMTNKEFDEFMVKLRDGLTDLSIIAPNGDNEVKLSVENAKKVGSELGVKFFHKLTYKGKKDIPDYTTPIEYLIIDLPIRRASQLLIKKLSVPEDNHSVDLATGQVTNSSAGAKISYPELQMLSSMGLKKTLLETFKVRGGDQGALRAMDAILEKNGTVRSDQILPYATGVQSTKTLKHIFNAAQLKINI